MSEATAAGWTALPLGDVADLQLGKMLDKARNLDGRPLHYLRNINVRWGSFDTDDLATMRFTDDEAAKFSIRDGDVLVCEGGEPGRAAVWRGGATDLKFQKAIHRVRPGESLSSDWIAFFLRYAATTGSLTDSFTGTTIKHLPAQALAAVTIPVPPLAEQRRIVARIEALFARTRRARADLERVAPLARLHRERSLAAAFPAPEDAGDGTTVANLLAEPAANGISVRGSDEPPGIRALRLDALRLDGLDLSRVRYIEIPEAKARRLCVKRGDFFVSRGNGTLSLLARGAFAEEPEAPTVFPDTMIRLRFNRSRVHADWLALAWGAPAVRMQIVARAKTTAGIWKVSQADLETVRLLAPGLQEQSNTAKRVRRQLTGVLRAEHEATRALALLDRLEQSILARAFRGELVPQDRADEPAAAILARQRATPTTSTRRRTRAPP